MRGAGLLLCAVLIAGCETSSVDVAATPSRSAAPSPVAITDAPPASCHGPTLRTVDTHFGAGIGSSPVYAIGDWDASGTMHTDGAQLTQYGEAIKILWVVQPGYQQEVEVRASSATTGGLLYFDLGSGPTTDLVLNPSTAAVNFGWSTFLGYVYVPAADCYFIEARWSGGSWRVEFPAGA